MSGERESGETLEVEDQTAKKDIGSAAGKPPQDRLDMVSKIAPIVTASVNVLVLLTIASQFRLNEDVAYRAWRSQLISTIYDIRCVEIPPLVRDSKEQPEAAPGKSSATEVDEPAEDLQVTEPLKEQCSPSLRSRQEAVWAYIELQREYKKPVKLANADLSGMILSHKDLSKADLKKANLHGAELIGARLQEADLDGSRLEKAKLNNARLYKAILTHANLQGAQLEDSDLQGALLEDAVLGICGEQQFEDATGIPHNSASLKRAKLKGASLKNASMCGVNIRDTDLSQVKDHLAKEQIDVARGNKNTSIPSYLPRPKDWETDNQ